jgi:hypothetical protein
MSLGDELICSSPETVPSTSVADYSTDRRRSSTVHVLQKCGTPAPLAKKLTLRLKETIN